jgi:hypothetical protein
MIKRSNIKEAFGGEVAFTKFIATDVETSKRLLNALDLDEEDYSVTPEEHTVHSKRVDLVVRDQEGDIFLVIESQDASGWLDSVHASKITYYMYDKKCDDGVLICEDADEHIKGFVRWLNENTPLRITLVGVVIYESNKNPYCEFIPLIRPTQTQDKKIVRKSNPSTDLDNNVTEQCQLIYDNNPGTFTNVAKYYVSKTNVGGTGLTVAISPYKTGGANSNGWAFVEIWHAGKANTDEFRKTFKEVCDKNSLEAKFQNRRGYVNGTAIANADDAVRIAKIFISALETKEINI